VAGLDEFLNSSAEAQETAEPAAEPEAQAPEPEAEGAPAAPQASETHVPLAALEAERQARKDHKGRADRLEGEMQAMREQLARFQQGQPQPQFNPLESMQQQIVNERFNTSEMLVKQAHQDADEVVGVFMEAAKANPALSAALQQQRHPWDFAYKEGKRLLMLREVGDDPAAYKERLKAELLAEIQGSAKPAPVAIPQSLNGARSVAPRSAPAWTGPEPLESILHKR